MIGNLSLKYQRRADDIENGIYFDDIVLKAVRKHKVVCSTWHW